MKAGLTRGMGLTVGGGGVKRSSSNPLLSDWPISPGLDRKEVSSISLSSLFPNISLVLYILYRSLSVHFTRGLFLVGLRLCLNPWNRLMVEYE